MKKFLTVLLALSVVFTYSFSAVGTAFAAESHSLDEYASALTNEKAAQLNYLNSAKSQAINELEFDKDGYTTDGYMKGAYEAAADKVISDATAKMDEAINNVLNSQNWPKPDAPDLDVVRNVTKSFNGHDLTTAAGMTGAMKAETDTLNKAQAPLTKAAVEAKLDVDLSKYNSTDKKYTAAGEPGGTELTAVQAVERAISIAREEIAKADKLADGKAKIDAYKDVAKDFDDAMKKIKTLADEEFDENINAGTVDAAVEQLATILLNDLKTDLDINPAMTANDTEDWSAITAGALKAFWEADKTNTNKGEFFGVAIANIAKVTRTEVAAVNTASKAAVAAAKAPIKAYANGDVSKITALGGDANKANRYVALANASKAVKVYEDVVAAGEKMKAAYEYGIKVYDDAAVAQAVKAAEKLVYADLMGTFDTAEEYIKEAAKNEGITLEAVNFELQKFNKAVEDAAKKMYKDGTAARTPQVKVLYGDNKTPEADFVYLKETYYRTEATAWAKIAQKAVADLKDAQSYDEITAIMNKAAEEFDKLLHNDVADDVIKARASYVTALKNYGTLKKGLLDDKDYPNANIDAAVAQGTKLINKATTVAGVEAAYEEAKAIVDTLKTAYELKAAKEAVEKQIAALPYTAKLTVADKAAVKAVYEAFDAYMNMPGASDIAPASLNLLKEKYNKVNELAAAEIDAKAKALNEKLAKVYTGSDSDVAARVALKAEADAVKAEAEALTDEIEAVNEAYASFLKVPAMSEVTKLAAHDFMDDLVLDAEIKLVKAAKEGATVEEMKAALEAYNKLTDKQKYTLDASVLQMANLVKTKLVAAVEGLKITVSTKLYTASNKIRVNWKTKGQADAADGYYVYKSTKAQKNYKFMGKTKKSYMDNKKNLKKGTRYFYKVRAYVEIDGQKYFSDYSNKGNRIYR